MTFCRQMRKKVKSDPKGRCQAFDEMIKEIVPGDRNGIYLPSHKKGMPQFIYR